MANKLLLLEDVEALGRSGDIVSVRAGYARNFLLPQRLAIVANAQALRMQARLQEERQQKAQADRQEAEEIAAKLQEASLTTVVKVDHDGHMYGSVTLGDVLDLLKEQTGIELEKKSLLLKNPLKKTGLHQMTVRLKEGVSSIIQLKIMSEEESNSAQTA